MLERTELCNIRAIISKHINVAAVAHRKGLRVNNSKLREMAK